MRNKGALLAFCIFFHVFIKSMVSSPLCSNGLYQHWDVGTGKRLYCCREVLVKRGYEAVPCTENEAEDSIRKCPVGQYQPDKTNSSNSPQCFSEPECTEEGIKKDTCIDEYCWPVCICNLEVGKCGHYPLNCLDVRDIKCMGKILQDCSCAVPDIPKQLPTSPPTRSNTLKPINPDRTAITSSPIPTGMSWTGSTQITNTTAVTKDGSDTGAKGNEAVYIIPIIICSIGLVIVVVLCIRYAHKRRSNRPIEVHQGSIEMLGSDPADKNNGINPDKVSETTDSGVCGLSKGSDENLEPGETDSNSINVSNGSDVEGGRNINNSVGDDRDVCQGQSLSQVEVHNYFNPREEPTLADDRDSFLESDPLLSLDECAVTSLQGKKKVAVVSPFNEGQTVPVAHSPPRENSENQQLRDEGYPEGENVVELDSMNWTTLGSSINHDSIN